MDNAIEDNIRLPRTNNESIKSRENELMSIFEVGEKLRKAVPGIAVIDNDFTLKPKEYELGLGGKEPGRLPEESMKLLTDLKTLGWQVLVVSNQPKEGHQIARLVKKLGGGKYPIFLDSVKEVLGDKGVDGGGKDFLWNKYKNTPEAISKTSGWIMENSQKVIGQIYFIGDRDSDVNFANKVETDLKNRGENRAVNIWKIKGFNLPKKMNILEKFVP